MHITLLDVGAGDAILIETPTGRYVLVGGGSSPSRLSSAIGRRLPLFQRELDYLVVASPVQEQTEALPSTVERFPPGSVLWAGRFSASYAARELQKELTGAGIPIVTAERGHLLDLGSSASMEVLEVGHRGAILLFHWDHFRAVFPIGAEFDDLEALRYGEDIGKVNVLLLADSGFAPLNPPEWIDNLRPDIVLISVQAGNYDGLPSQETLEILNDYNILRTDQNGWIHLETDGENVWIEVER
jgi:competence protein ComEC